MRLFHTNVAKLVRKLKNRNVTPIPALTPPPPPPLHLTPTPTYCHEQMLHVNDKMANMSKSWQMTPLLSAPPPPSLPPSTIPFPPNPLRRHLGLAGNAVGPCGAEALLQVMGPLTSSRQNTRIIDKPVVPLVTNSKRHHHRDGGGGGGSGGGSSLSCDLFVDLQGCCLERKLADGESLTEAANATTFDPSASTGTYRSSGYTLPPPTINTQRPTPHTPHPSIPRCGSPFLRPP